MQVPTALLVSLVLTLFYAEASPVQVPQGKKISLSFEQLSGDAASSMSLAQLASHHHGLKNYKYAKSALAYRNNTGQELPFINYDVAQKLFDHANKEQTVDLSPPDDVLQKVKDFFNAKNSNPLTSGLNKIEGKVASKELRDQHVQLSSSGTNSSQLHRRNVGQSGQLLGDLLFGSQSTSVPMELDTTTSDVWVPGALSLSQNRYVPEFSSTAHLTTQYYYSGLSFLGLNFLGLKPTLIDGLVWKDNVSFGGGVGVDQYPVAVNQIDDTAIQLPGGALGLGWPSLSNIGGISTDASSNFGYIQQLYLNHLLPDALFAVDYKTVSLDLGSYDPSRANITWAPIAINLKGKESFNFVSNSYWAFDNLGIRANGHEYNAPNAIIDTTQSFTFLPFRTAIQFFANLGVVPLLVPILDINQGVGHFVVFMYPETAVWPENTGFVFQGTFIPVTAQSLSSGYSFLGNAVAGIMAKDLLVKGAIDILEPINYLIDDVINDQITTLGHSFLRNAYVVFDFNNNRIGAGPYYDGVGTPN